MAYFAGTSGILLIIGIILLIVGIILAIVYRTTLSSKWWIWIIIGLGVLFGIIGLIVGAVGAGREVTQLYTSIGVPEVSVADILQDYSVRSVGYTPVPTINTAKL